MMLALLSVFAVCCSCALQETAAAFTTPPLPVSDVELMSKSSALIQELENIDFDQEPKRLFEDKVPKHYDDHPKNYRSKMA